ncbi:MAG TPA: hypothetical protein VHH36_00730, partial [Candidatus Thermoplasmatota archaeon]|nr:hypothetical protein [Candidatus Thermoplasmatota archaeon]
LLERPAVIAATSFDGAFAAWTGAWALAREAPPKGLVALAAVVALAVAGFVAQTRWTARPR